MTLLPESTDVTRRGSGRFIISLCETAGPVRIPQADRARLDGLRFFSSEARSGGSPYRVHMGYFSTRAAAERWLQVLRPVYPKAIVRELLDAQPDELTDSQVMRTLEARRVGSSQDHLEDSRARAIPLVAPEETGTRRALRDTVRRGEPVSFAVQLQWSTQPIDLQRVHWDPIFRFYILYTTRARYQQREWFCLRLGFFRDALSAKQVALYLRRGYASAAVVPVGTDERDVAALPARRAER